MEYSKACRELRRTEACVQNRLKSIVADNQWLRWVLDNYGTDEDEVKYPVMCNLRCGEWYARPGEFQDFCHFKSTDGHYGTWDFSLSRLNVNVLSLAERQGCVVIIDATRKGKVFPDSFLRTIPIWCAVINRIKGFIPRSEKLSHKETRYFTPSERDQVDAKIQKFIDKAIQSGVLWEELHLSKPLLPLHVSRETDFLKTRPDPDYNTLFLLSVCSPEPDHRLSFTYVQGAGDDHQSWSKGLTPQLFWENVDALLEGGPLDCLDTIEGILQTAEEARKNNPSTGVVLSKVNLGDVVVSLGKGVFADGCINIIDRIGEGKGPICIDGRVTGEAGPCLTVLVQNGSKKDLEKALPHIFSAVAARTADFPSVTISCPTGTGTAVAVFVAVVQKFSPSGWSIPFPAAPLDPCIATKDGLRKILAKATTYIPGACPSRNDMKQVNRFFMSDGRH